MPAFALPWVAPAAGEGLLWGAGALGTGLAALGIIENKDAIRNGISDFGNWVSTGVQNGIRSWSDAMSPKGPVGPNPNYDVATGRPIAVQDATRVQMPLLRQPIQPRPFGATRSTRRDSDGEPIFFPWQAGSPEKPIQLRPVTVMGSRVMRTDAEGAQPTTDTSSSQSTQGTSVGTTSPAPVDPENPRRKKPRKQKTQAEKDAALDAKYERKGWQPMSQRRRFWSIEHPIRYARQYPWRAAGRTVLGVGTAVGPYEMRNTFWPAVGNTAERFFLGPDSIPAGSTNSTKQATTTQSPDTVTAVTTNQLPDSTITNQGDDFEQWLKARQTQ